jgi:hypothetical protein
MKTKFFVCVNNDGYHASLEKRKLYQVIEDRDAEVLNLVRIIDESGEDYLFPSNHFLGIKLNKDIEEAIMMA